MLNNFYPAVILDTETESESVELHGNLLAYIHADATVTVTLQVKYYSTDDWHTLHDSSGAISLSLTDGPARLLTSYSLVGIHAIRAVANSAVGADTTITFVTVE